MVRQTSKHPSASQPWAPPSRSFDSHTVLCAVLYQGMMSEENFPRPKKRALRTTRRAIKSAMWVNLSVHQVLGSVSRWAVQVPRDSQPYTWYTRRQQQRCCCLMFVACRSPPHLVTHAHISRTYFVSLFGTHTPHTQAPTMPPVKVDSCLLQAHVVHVGQPPCSN